MGKVLCIVFAMLSAAWADLSGDCNLVSFYKELGCKTLPNIDNSTTCPDAFECPDLHPNPNQCYYRGLPYTDGAMIPENRISDPCTTACYCSTTDTPQFYCAAVDCVEYFGTGEPNECILTYELDACCSTGSVCGKDAIAALKTCELEGKTYKEGQAFEPPNTRKTCICTAQWNGTLDDPTICRDISCGMEIHYQDKLTEHCAPVFFGNSRSCPIDFECPTNSTKIIRGLNVRSVAQQCSFGNTTLSVGDAITVEETCTKCTCEVPPFVSCIRKSFCNE